MTGFNKTLDVNLEHTGLEYTHNQSRNHQQFCLQKIRNTKGSVFSNDPSRCCSAFRAFVCTFFDPPKIRSPLAFNDAGAEIVVTSRRCNIVTLRRRDVGSLIDFLLLTRRRDVVTSRRSSQYFPCFLCLAPNRPKTTLLTYNSQKLQKSYLDL